MTIHIECGGGTRAALLNRGRSFRRTAQFIRRNDSPSKFASNLWRSTMPRLSARSKRRRLFVESLESRTMLTTLSVDINDASCGAVGDNSYHETVCIVLRRCDFVSYRIEVWAWWSYWV